eukprot:293393_1
MSINSVSNDFTEMDSKSITTISSSLPKYEGKEIYNAYESPSLSYNSTLSMNETQITPFNIINSISSFVKEELIIIDEHECDIQSDESTDSESESSYYCQYDTRNDKINELNDESNDELNKKLQIELDNNILYYIDSDSENEKEEEIIIQIGKKTIKCDKYDYYEYSDSENEWEGLHVLDTLNKIQNTFIPTPTCPNHINTLNDINNNHFKDINILESANICTIKHRHNTVIINDIDDNIISIGEFEYNNELGLDELCLEELFENYKKQYGYYPQNINKFHNFCRNIYGYNWKTINIWWVLFHNNN